jgi:uncharacterized repeat protein (TIGR01451 family)
MKRIANIFGMLALTAIVFLNTISAAEAQLTFSTPIDITQDPNTNSAPLGKRDHVVKAVGSSIYVVWSEFSQSYNVRDLYFTRSTDEGATWSTGINISNTPQTVEVFPQLAVVGSNIYILWADSNINAYFFAYSHDYGQTFSSPINLTYQIPCSYCAPGPVMAANETGVYVVWSSDPYDGVLNFMSSTDGGATFTSPITIPGTPCCSTGEISMVANGQVLHIFELAYHGLIYFRSTDGGQTFESFRRVHDTSPEAFVLALLETRASGTGVYVSYQKNRPDSARDVVFVGSTDNGVTFSSPTIISGTFPTACNQDNPFEVSGMEIYRAWINYDGTCATRILAHSSDGGTTWPPPIVLPTGGPGPTDSLGLAINGSQVYLTWSDSRVLFSFSTDYGVTFSAPLQISPFVDLFDGASSVILTDHKVNLIWKNSDTTPDLFTSGAEIGTTDLSVTKTAFPDPVVIGSNLTYTLTVANGGPSTATGVILSDTLPGNVTYVSATPNQGTCSGTSTVICTLGSLANGASVVVTIAVTPISAGTLSNTATISGNETDPNTANNSVTTTTTVINTYTLTLTTAGTGSGTTSGAGTYNYNQTATVIATANTGSTFSGWSGPNAAECTTGSVLMTANKSCTATFTLNQTITFVALGNKIYGDVPFTVNAMGGASGNPVTFTATPAGVCTSSGANGSTITIIGVGVCTVTAHQAGNSNYNAAPDVPQSFTVTKATLTVTADNKTKLLNTPLPTLTATMTGFKNGETLATSGVTGSPSLTTTVTTTSPVGNYPIIVALGTLASNNYSFTFANGTLVIQYVTSGLCGGAVGHMILQPINADGTSVFKQKSTVPAKFRVCDANGVSIGTPGVVANFRLIQIVSGTVVDTVDEAVDSTTPDASFRWDSTGQQWIFNMNTKSLSTNETYFYQITLNDGSTINFNFGLK